MTGNPQVRQKGYREGAANKMERGGGRGKVLALHQGLHKAESSLLVQLRTEKIGLRDFLFNIGAPEVTPVDTNGKRRGP
jgi:hypothetical protein